MTRPLRIADFSTHLSGPLASQLLVQGGAEVIKIENPRTGDGNRTDFEVVDGLGMLHLALNPGTRSLAVDRRSEDWPKVVAACAQWADAVLVGARPVDARRRGMDFATMRAANPKLIYCSISGFGDDGPWRDFTAHGQTIDTLAGLVPVVPGEPQPTTREGWRTAGTTLGGMFAALAVLAAVNRRDRGADHAQYLSVSLWHAAMWWSWRDVTMLANTGERWLDYTDLGSRYSLYETADERVLLLAPIERKFWQPFCDIIGLPAEYREQGDWESSGMEFGEGEAFERERQEIASRVRGRTLDGWIPELQAAEIPFAPVLTVQEALASEHAETSGIVRETTVDGRTLKVPASPVRSARDDSGFAAPSELSAPPRIGEHTEELLRELGIRP